MKKYPKWTKSDKTFMKIALKSTWIAKGTTSPNPVVGALIVKDRKIIGTDFTQPYGGLHAERVLLSRLSLSRTIGATLYITLEPCCIHGNTPPCTDIIIEKKIKRVVISSLDPNPRIKGRGVEILKKAKIQVDVGLYEKIAQKINRDFFTWIQDKRPLVSFKYAMTLDGKIATPVGDSKWISSERSRRISHILRYRSDAVLVGVNTVIYDDPELNARLINRKKNLLRIILDPQGRTPLDSRVASDSFPTLFAVKEKRVSKRFVSQIENRIEKRIWFDNSPEKQIDLKKLLSFLGNEKITSLLIEGGSNVFGGFLDQGIGDQVFIFLGDQIIGEGLSPFCGFKIKFLKNGVKIDDILCKKINNNILIHGKIQWKGKETEKDILIKQVTSLKRENSK